MIAKRLANWFRKPVYIGKVFGPCETHGVHKGWTIKVDERFSLTFWNHLPYVRLIIGHAAKIEYASPYAWKIWNEGK